MLVDIFGSCLLNSVEVVCSLTLEFFCQFLWEVVSSLFWSFGQLPLEVVLQRWLEVDRQLTLKVFCQLLLKIVLLTSIWSCLSTLWWVVMHLLYPLSTSVRSYLPTYIRSYFFLTGRVSTSLRSFSLLPLAFSTRVESCSSTYIKSSLSNFIKVVWQLLLEVLCHWFYKFWPTSFGSCLSTSVGSSSSTSTEVVLQLLLKVVYCFR